MVILQPIFRVVGELYEHVTQSLELLRFQAQKNFAATRRLTISSLKFNDQRDLVLKTMMERLEFLERQCKPLESGIWKIARDRTTCLV